jgi:hypothetical protein
VCIYVWVSEYVHIYGCIVRLFLLSGSRLDHLELGTIIKIYMHMLSYVYEFLYYVHMYMSTIYRGMYICVVGLFLLSGSRLDDLELGMYMCRCIMGICICAYICMSIWVCICRYGYIVGLSL